MTCRHCNRPEAEHHEYEAVVVLPPGCKCDPAHHPDGPLPICGEYRSWSERYDTECRNCDHERACHAPAGGDNEGG